MQPKVIDIYRVYTDCEKSWDFKLEISRPVKSLKWTQVLEFTLTIHGTSVRKFRTKIDVRFHENYCIF